MYRSDTQQVDYRQVKKMDITNKNTGIKERDIKYSNWAHFWSN